MRLMRLNGRSTVSVFFCGSQAEYGVRNTTMRETDELHPLSEYGKAKAKVGREAVMRAEALA
ncbi:MAG: hypothetical protein ACLRZ6_04390 [Lachnospiraceae bacterium]